MAPNQKKKTAIKRSYADRIFDFVNVSLTTIILLLVLYPLYFTLIASVSDPTQVALGKTALFVKGFTLEPYYNVFKNNKIWLGYRNTIIYTFFGTLWNLFLTIPTAYVLSKQNLPGRSAISWYYLFTMYFGGGLIPTYLMVNSIGLINRPYTIIIMSGISIFNIIVSRVFFESSIPEELYDAARIDGASDFGQFFRIALPLATPIIAVMALYYSVGRWNDYFTAMIFLNDSKYAPLQIVLRDILIQNKGMASMLTQEQLAADEKLRLYYERLRYMSEGMKYSLIYIASAPMLIAYPFVQKYFVKGVMIGSLKG